MLDAPLGLTQINALDAYCCATGSNPSSPHSPLKRGDVIEIQGPPASGKTHVVYHLVATCVLPVLHRSVKLHGWEKAAIVFDTDGSFDIRRLKQIIEHRLQRLISSEDEIPAVIEQCLKRIALIRVTSTLQLAVSIINSPSYLARLFPGSELGILAVDSLSTFYWPDRFAAEGPVDDPSNSRPVAIDNRFRNVVTALQKIRSSLCPVIVLTNWGLTPASRGTGPPTFYRQHLNPWPDPFTPPREGLDQYIVPNPALPAISFHVTTAVDSARLKFSGHLRCPGSETIGRMDFRMCEEGAPFG